MSASKMVLARVTATVRSRKCSRGGVKGTSFNPNFYPFPWMTSRSPAPMKHYRIFERRKGGSVARVGVKLLPMLCGELALGMFSAENAMHCGIS